ncbi:hypothetical protein N7522_012695 [Penicillium canescens]|uniref:RRM domain-containing protein n=1 Tax=Penicillium canescens TaxID=5083 RepID=A0AAD6N2J4_PENCN|nr:uncharacterized protein N7446_013252 [Penicillium canescens]KAJ5985499.1 hypothetical protein N7522_012695 [Penicillium canescens]KAJ6022899.1 hypothetical protein N7460_013294 [Penicillium canescens]KAJ6025839.1 hypothetical protein N7444_013518 [Penicillium canescens]KAJ6042186.1 hypothetical protein N7446_013252 [Penicillium canescens]
MDSGTPETASRAGSVPAGSFPTDPSEFDKDPRVSFSKLDNQYILETDDDREFLWDTGIKRWVESIDEELLRQQQEAYKVEGVDETEAAHPRDRKRKQNHDAANEPKQKKPRVNCAVYVTSIPLDATMEEINTVFKKFGLITEEIDTGKPRIKMYEDEAGNFKGDALVVYFRSESVDIAIQMLDETDFRYGVTGPHGPMRVQAADAAWKSDEANQKPDQNQKQSTRSKTDQRKIAERAKRFNEKLGWDSEEEGPVYTKYDHMVTLKHMFTLKELDDDPAAILEIKEDIRDECEKFGEVTNTVLYDLEPEGVVTVRFKDPAAARSCVEAFSGRKFSGREVVAYVQTGRERYRKSGTQRDALEGIDTEAEEQKRLDRFGDFLEGK